MLSGKNETQHCTYFQRKPLSFYVWPLVSLLLPAVHHAFGVYDMKNASDGPRRHFAVQKSRFGPPFRTLQLKSPRNANLPPFFGSKVIPAWVQKLLHACVEFLPAYLVFPVYRRFFSLLYFTVDKAFSLPDMIFFYQPILHKFFISNIIIYLISKKPFFTASS